MGASAGCTSGDFYFRILLELNAYEAFEIIGSGSILYLSCFNPVTSMHATKFLYLFAHL